MPLDPAMEEVLRVVGAGPEIHRTPIPALRVRRARLDLPGAERVAGAEDLVIHGPDGALPARLYRPAYPADAAPPLAVFFHGGGFVFGSLDSHYDGFCRALCGVAGCHVLSADYRLAPEHPFPAATDDCIAAMRWAFAHASRIGADPRRVVVAGGSAGGNLAAATALRLRDEGGPVPCGQLLVYPMVAPHEPATASAREFATGYYLTRADTVWFWEQYLGGPAPAAHPYAAPMLATSLAGLPPALVLTAEYDPLRDEGEAYAMRMRGAGVPVTLTRCAGMLHGFLAFPTGRTAEVVREAAAWMGNLAPAG